MNFHNIFKALSDETRLRIINLILSSGKSLCVCEIVDALNLPQYLISKHLNVLKNSGLIKGNKEGKWVYCSLDEEGLSLKHELFGVLKNHLKGQVFQQDRKNLKVRLSKRKNNKCVIGF